MDPEIDYHLEFNISSIKLCKLLMDAIQLLKNIKFNPKIIERKNSFSIYIKGSEKIEELFSSHRCQNVCNETYANQNGKRST